jgi:hypothetical protein
MKRTERCVIRWSKLYTGECQDAGDPYATCFGIASGQERRPGADDASDSKLLWFSLHSISVLTACLLVVLSAFQVLSGTACSPSGSRWWIVSYMASWGSYGQRLLLAVFSVRVKTTWNLTSRSAPSNCGTHQVTTVHCLALPPRRASDTFRSPDYRHRAPHCFSARVCIDGQNPGRVPALRCVL